MDVPLEWGKDTNTHIQICVSILVLVDVPLEYLPFTKHPCLSQVSILVLVDVPLEYSKTGKDVLIDMFQSLF